MATQSFEYFFDLPPELREQILEYLCVFPSGILVGGSVAGGSVCLRPAKSAADAIVDDSDDGDEDEGGEEQQPADPPLNLFLASPILYREAGDLYYGRNVFHLDVASVAWGRGLFSAAYDSTSTSSSHRLTSAAATRRGRLSGNRRGVDTLMRLLKHPDTASARRRICSAVVLVRRPGGLVTDVLNPTLGDMVMNGALRRLCVDVIEINTVSEAREVLGRVLVQRLKGMDYSENPALRGLLVLLADPEMERATLRVPRGLHAWFWCQFHEGGGSGGGGSGRGCAMSGRRDGRLLEVDIRKLADACAGDSADFRIMKVEGRRP